MTAVLSSLQHSSQSVIYLWPGLTLPVRGERVSAGYFSLAEREMDKVTEGRVGRDP